MIDTNLPIDKSAADYSAIQSKLNEIGGTKAASGKNLSPVEKIKLEKAARGFESIFVNLMYKEMKKSVDKAKESSSLDFGADTLSGYGDMMFSDYISKTGKGIGIAEKIYEALTGGDKLSASKEYIASTTTKNNQVENK